MADTDGTNEANGLKASNIQASISMNFLRQVSDEADMEEQAHGTTIRGSSKAENPCGINEMN